MKNHKLALDNQKINLKYQKLLDYLKSLGSAAVAFSGGVDSAFLLHTAVKALGNQVIAVTASSHLFPKRELEEAKDFCKERGIRHIVFESEELDIDGFRQNPKNRCYLCKHELFVKILAIAKENGVAAVAEGSNVDDNDDYRPGLIAVKELGIASPLRYAEFTKEEIRSLSKEFALPTWDKQSFACLASRFVYGETISEEKLQMIDRAEQLLLDLGFKQVRVRIHGTVSGIHGTVSGIHGTAARIEIMPQEFGKIVEEGVRTRINTQFKKYGFSYVTLDLMGYRTGSMNETLY
ncbi:MAG: ATP-dependent sacrificial sulfur transferase LarE [Clostridiaceae bacterium]|nr:ATP-dependent sacrificial sulfur transferase LarE [Clostridiaceae bacterium]